MENIKWAFKLWSLTIVIPIVITIIILFSIILGIDSPFTIGEGLYKAWIGYYFTGTVEGIVAWRIHLVLLISCYLFVLLEKD